MNRAIAFAFACTPLFCSVVLSAATPYVGIAVSNEPFLLNGVTAAGNATLFSGSIVETSAYGSELRLQDGSRLFLAPRSRGQVFADRALIERGSARLDTSGAYRLEALSLRIAGGMRHTDGIVAIHGPTVEVYAVAGNMLVANAGGVVVGRVQPRQDLSFTAASSSETSRVRGVLTRESGAFRLTDEVSNARLELRGSGLGSQVGQRIEVTGTPVRDAHAAQGTSEVIQVASLKLPAVSLNARSLDGALQAEPGSGLNIVIVEGEGAINNIRQRTAREEIIQVEDENHRPVAGAAVSFLLPDSGPSGTFPDGSRLFSTVTNEKGQAVARFQPNEEAGKFKIKVDANSKGRSSSVLISAVNSFSGAPATTAASLGGITRSPAVIGGFIVAAGIGVITAASAAGLIFSDQGSTPISISPGR